MCIVLDRHFVAFPINAASGVIVASFKYGPLESFAKRGQTSDPWLNDVEA
jgi:hypothetical protein